MADAILSNDGSFSGDEVVVVVVVVAKVSRPFILGGRSVQRLQRVVVSISRRRGRNVGGDG